MNIGNVAPSNPLLKHLESNGLSASKAKLVQSDLKAAAAAGGAGSSPAALSPAVRAAFDTRIAADVAAGRLSASDAAAVKKTMDDGEVGSGAGAAAAPAASDGGDAAPAGGAAGGGGSGGGGGGAGKTELSETVTISGPTKTTVVTYTDGTTSTTATTATEADKAKYERHGATGATGASSDGYAAQIDKGSLVDQLG